MFTILFLGAVLAVFLTLGAVRGDAERGLLQPLVVRPVGRTSLLLGRFAGAAAVCALYVALVYAAAVADHGHRGRLVARPGRRPGLGPCAGGGRRSRPSRCSARSSCPRRRTASPSSCSSARASPPACSARSATRSRCRRSQDVAKVSSWLLPFEALYQAGLHGLTADTSGITGVIVKLGPVRRRPEGERVAVGLDRRLPGPDRRRGARRVRPPRPLIATSTRLYPRPGGCCGP